MRFSLLLLAMSGLSTIAAAETPAVSYGPRPAFLIDLLPEGDLKTKLASCEGQTPKATAFSIGHRGAALMYPEHTAQSYIAGARSGAGIVECDVTFTKDKQLVCRHAQNDLHTTTNILLTDLAAKCTKGFAPAKDGTDASAECRTSDLTHDEFMTLSPKMDSADKTATTAEAYQGGVADWRTTLYAAPTAKIMDHKASIELIKSLGAKFTPELKAPAVDMPFDGFSYDDYRQKMIDEYKEAGIPPQDVWAQSFVLDDVLYWIEHEPEFGKQAVFLTEGDQDGFDPENPATFGHDFKELKSKGVNYVAPALWMLVTDKDGKIAPSAYAKALKDADMKIITWTLERSGPLTDGGGWYFQTIKDITKDGGDYYKLLDVLAKDVGVVGVFSDWPATVTYYANCMGL